MATTQEVIETIPRRTIEYFATTYTATPYGTVIDMATEQLVDKIKQCGMLSKVIEVYNETIRSVENEKNKYRYFIRHYGHESETPLPYEKVISALDDSHLFGKAVFMLLLNIGTMETASETYKAVKKEHVTVR